jgi:hypothetical protein
LETGIFPYDFIGVIVMVFKVVEGLGKPWYFLYPDGMAVP